MTALFYDYRKSLKKSAEFFLFYAIPTLISYVLDTNPVLFSISVGTLLKLLSDYLKHKHDDPVFDNILKKVKNYVRFLFGRNR